MISNESWEWEYYSQSDGEDYQEQDEEKFQLFEE